MGSQNAASRGGQNAFGILNMLGQINQAEQMGNPGSPGFVAPSQLRQQAPYQPNLPQATQQLSPLTQQIMQRSMAPQPIMGLPAALMQMQGRLNQPMMRPQMPVYQNPALAYRPNMPQNLNRVAPRPVPQEQAGAEPPQTEFYNWRTDPYAGG